MVKFVYKKNDIDINRFKTVIHPNNENNITN